MLEERKIIHMDINDNTVMYDRVNGTLALSDFSMSFEESELDLSLIHI